MGTAQACRTWGKTSGQDPSSQAFRRDWHGQQGPSLDSEPGPEVMGGWFGVDFLSAWSSRSRTVVKAEQEAHCNIRSRRHSDSVQAVFLLGDKLNLQIVSRHRTDSWKTNDWRRVGCRHPNSAEAQLLIGVLRHNSHLQPLVRLTDFKISFLSRHSFIVTCE